jgi:hypothetical protein
MYSKPLSNIIHYHVNEMMHNNHVLKLTIGFDLDFVIPRMDHKARCLVWRYHLNSHNKFLVHTASTHQEATGDSMPLLHCCWSASSFYSPPFPSILHLLQLDIFIPSKSYVDDTSLSLSLALLTIHVCYRLLLTY